MMVSVAAPERTFETNDAFAAADLSPSKAAMEAAFPVITPATLPIEVSCFLSFHAAIVSHLSHTVMYAFQAVLCASGSIFTKMVQISPLLMSSLITKYSSAGDSS